MSDVDRLTTDLDALEQQSVETGTDLDTLYDNLDAVDQILQDVKAIDDDLQDLDIMLSSAHDALTMVQVILTIRTEAKALDDQVQLLRTPVHNARKTADGVEEKVKPWRDALEKIEKSVDGVRTTVKLVRDFTPKAESIVLSLEKCIIGLPDGPVKTGLQQKLDSASRTVDPAVVNLTLLLKELDEPVSRVNAALDAARSKFGVVSRLSDELKDLIDKLRLIMDPLDNLVAALSHRIGIGKFKFTIKEILEGIKLPWPFGHLVDKFESLAMSFLQPYLHALHLGISLPGIADLNALDGFAASFGTIYDGISGDLAKIGDLIAAFEKAENDIVDSMQLFDIKCPPG